MFKLNFNFYNLYGDNEDKIKIFTKIILNTLPSDSVCNEYLNGLNEYNYLKIPDKSIKSVKKLIYGMLKEFLIFQNNIEYINIESVLGKLIYISYCALVDLKHSPSQLCNIENFE